jgi:hypothetical protein
VGVPRVAGKDGAGGAGPEAALAPVVLARGAVAAQLVSTASVACEATGLTLPVHGFIVSQRPNIMYVLVETGWGLTEMLLQSALSLSWLSACLPAPSAASHMA